MGWACRFQKPDTKRIGAAPICPARAGLHEYAVPTTASTRGGGARNSTPAGPIAPTMRANLAAAACLDRLGRYEPATTIAGCAFDPAHLRDVLADQTYESLTRAGKSMTTSEMVAYACDQIDQGPNRTERCLERDHIRERGVQQTRTRTAAVTVTD